MGSYCRHVIGLHYTMFNNDLLLKQAPGQFVLKSTMIFPIFVP